MRSRSFYKALLRLYPADFRKQFSEEMLCVFQQRAGDHFAGGKAAALAFLSKEFISVLKGAYLMWLGRIVSINRKQIRAGIPESSGASLTVAQAIEQRNVAIKNMVAAIATHDFLNARRYSDEEIRLKAFIERSERGGRVESVGTA